MTIKEKNLKLIMELIFIFILPLAVIGINCKLDNEYVYDNNGNFETSQKELIYSGIDYNVTYRNIIYGFNIWDEEMEVGRLSGSTGANQISETQLRSVNYIAVLPSTDYYFRIPNNTTNVVRICAYDENKNFVGVYIADSGQWESANSGAYNLIYPLFTTPSNAYYIRFNLGGTYGVTYKNDICINFSSSWANGYYVSHGEDLLIISDTDLSGQNNIVYSPFVNFKNMVAGAFNVDNTDTSFNIIFDYTCLWFLQFVIWHLLYGLFDFLMHLVSLKKKE